MKNTETFGSTAAMFLCGICPLSVKKLGEVRLEGLKTERGFTDQDAVLIANSTNNRSALGMTPVGVDIFRLQWLDCTTRSPLNLHSWLDAVPTSTSETNIASTVVGDPRGDRAFSSLRRRCASRQNTI